MVVARTAMVPVQIIREGVLGRTAQRQTEGGRPWKKKKETREKGKEEEENEIVTLILFFQFREGAVSVGESFNLECATVSNKVITQGWGKEQKAKKD